jgi:hypothetical protein
MARSDRTRRRSNAPGQCPSKTSTSAIRSCSARTHSGRTSTVCARKSRSTTAKTRCLVRTGPSPSTTTSWRSRPTTRCFRRPPRWAGSLSATFRPTCGARASLPWISHGMVRSARPWRQCSRRPISTSSRSTSVSVPPRASTTCRATRPLTGLTTSRSN